MSKVGPDGKVIKAPNGKVLKPEGYHKPKLADLALRAQR
jgi:predicted HAD superfamily Cof-like phosphohydrolase